MLIRLGCVLLLMLLTAACATAPVTPVLREPPPIALAVTPEDAQAYRGYLDVVERLEATPFPEPVQGRPIIDAIQQIADAAGVPLWIHREALDFSGKHPANPLSDIGPYRTAREALDQIMRCTDVDGPWGWTIINGSLVISTKHVAERNPMVRRLYICSDLMFVDLKLWYVQTGVNADELQEKYEQLWRKELSTWTCAWGLEDAPYYGLPWLPQRFAEQSQEVRANLAELIRDTCGDPLDWADRGGDAASLRVVNDLIFVTATPQRHRQIETTLSQLRDIAAQQFWAMIELRRTAEQLP